jgi:hypothetical protein
MAQYFNSSVDVVHLDATEAALDTLSPHPQRTFFVMPDDNETVSRLRTRYTLSEPMFSEADHAADIALVQLDVLPPSGRDTALALPESILYAPDRDRRSVWFFRAAIGFTLIGTLILYPTFDGMLWPLAMLVIVIGAVVLRPTISTAQAEMSLPEAMPLDEMRGWHMGAFVVGFVLLTLLALAIDACAARTVVWAEYAHSTPAIVDRDWQHLIGTGCGILATPTRDTHRLDRSDSHSIGTNLATRPPRESFNIHAGWLDICLGGGRL